MISDFFCPCVSRRCSMKKTETIVVRQPLVFRVFYLFFFIFLWINLILLCAFSKETESKMTIPISVSMAVLSVPFLYYFLWRIKFTSKSISFSVFFMKKGYSYSQIKDVLKYSSGLWGERIWIDLADGKRITMTSNYANYSKAIQILRQHRPIHTAPQR